MKILISHPTGNANVRAAALGCKKAGILSVFYTTMATFTGTLMDRLSTIGPFKELNRRRYDDELKSITVTWPWQEAGRILASKFKLKSLVMHEKGAFSVDAIYEGLDQKIASDLKMQASKGLTTVYAYEDGALLHFTEAKKHHLECIYDLPIGYWKAARELLKGEHERWPEWASTLTGFQDSAEKLQKKDEELRLADRIFVASSFTAKTLDAFEGNLAPIKVIPYGFPPIGAARFYDYTGKRPLRLLFVGGLSQRKGIADLFAAVKNIGNSVELTIVGQKTNAECPALDAALAEHTWIPSLSHAEVLKVMRSHDVLVFPSLFEGFGLVITEAMSQGTPVITTERTAGPDLIKHGENGWIIPAGSTEGLQKQIESLIASPITVGIAGSKARETAEERPWELYGKELSDNLIKIN
jgi:glycosyltransferase involved in cell wall biosynthesis